MVKQRNVENELDSLAERARALLSATSDIADEKVEQAREALHELLDAGSGVYSRARESAVAGAKIADKRVRENPYQAVGIALGIGAVLGFLVGRSRGSD
jgi:ElaB/YqjD/DUF883 family membrane-anchored ribosome-binding protein